MEEEPSRLHMTLVYFGFRGDGPPPGDEEGYRAAMRARRVTAVALVAILGYLAVATALGAA